MCLSPCLVLYVWLFRVLSFVSFLSFSLRAKTQTVRSNFGSSRAWETCNPRRRSFAAMYPKPETPKLRSNELHPLRNKQLFCCSWCGNTNAIDFDSDPDRGRFLQACRLGPSPDYLRDLANIQKKEWLRNKETWKNEAPPGTFPSSQQAMPTSPKAMPTPMGPPAKKHHGDAFTVNSEAVATDASSSNIPKRQKRPSEWAPKWVPKAVGGLFDIDDECSVFGALGRGECSTVGHLISSDSKS